MIPKTVMAAFVGLAFLTSAGQAAAQDWPPEGGSGDRPAWNGGEGGPRPDSAWGAQTQGGLLPPRAIMGSLFRRGYRDIDIKRVRGTSYIATAQSPRGYRVLVVVDGQTTEITGLRPIGYDRPQPLFDGGGFAPRPWGGPRW